MPGEANFSLWREAIAELRPAVMSGARLYDLGDFPMLIEAAAGEVRGMVVRVRRSSYSAALALLDELEGIAPFPPAGPMYRRARRLVRAAGGAVAAWVYVGNPRYVAGLEPINAPDWKTYVHGCGHLRSNPVSKP